MKSMLLMLKCFEYFEYEIIWKYLQGIKQALHILLIHCIIVESWNIKQCKIKILYEWDALILKLIFACLVALVIMIKLHFILTI